MNTIIRSGLASMTLILSLGFANTVLAQEFITNGSLTGPIVTGAVPDGWVILNGSPDTNDENNNVGGAACTFGADPTGPSPDGGTWVGFARDDGAFEEIFGQTVTGLTIGEEYELSWYAGNFGGGSCGYNGDNTIVVTLDGSAAGAGGALSLGSTWESQSITFTATSTSHDLAFGLADAAFSYLAIDGISLVASAVPPPPPVEAVPVPVDNHWMLAALALLMLAAGVIGIRRVG